MFARILVCSLILGSSACHRARSAEPAPAWLVQYVAEMDSRLRTVSATDGIDADEAKAIAGVYLVKYLTGCGVPDEAVLRGHTWVVSLRLGYAGAKSDRTIEVDSKSGGVWGLGGPRYGDFASFHYGVLVEVARDGR